MGAVHIIGAGPVGLFFAALLQSLAGQQVRIYERRPEYTRTRMVTLAPYLVADSIQTDQADILDGPNVAALFSPEELETRLAYRRTVAPDLKALIQAWTVGFASINDLETTLRGLIEERATGTVERIETTATRDGVLAALGPDDVIVDCSGTRSLFRDALIPGGDAPDQPNLMRVRLEYALVVTFLYSEHYECDEYCKYYKNADNPAYKFIPGVHRTYYDGSISHVTGIITITREEFDSMPGQFTGTWLREHFPAVAESMDRFMDKVRDETHGEVVGEQEIVRIPLDVYHARNFTSRPWRRSAEPGPLSTTAAFVLGDSAIGSPYFGSISLGFECAFFLAGHLANRMLPMSEIFDRYEAFMDKQFLRVYMRTTLIKHNKDLLAVVDDRFALLSKLHIY
jgi:2-polyprenyl-6-methoxyphenol hydroxylase-like FAD-dependent oxidoreductase